MCLPSTLQMFGHRSSKCLAFHHTVCVQALGHIEMSIPTTTTPLIHRHNHFSISRSKTPAPQTSAGLRLSPTQQSEIIRFQLQPCYQTTSPSRLSPELAHLALRFQRQNGALKHEERRVPILG